MKLHVKHFGPIKEAQVDIKPLTIFVGPSNSGKSYLATLIHAIVQSFVQFDSDSGQENKKLTQLAETYHAILTKNNMNISKDNVTSQKQLHERFMPITEGLLSLWCETFKTSWQEKMRYYFGEVAGKLLQNNELHISACSHDNTNIIDITKPEKSHFDTTIKNKICEGLVEGLIDRRPSLNIFENNEKRKTFVSKRDVFWFFYRTWHRYIHDVFYSQDKRFFPIHAPYGFRHSFDSNSIYYLPAVRSGIMQSHRLMINQAVQQATITGIKRASFHGIFAEFINNINNINKKTEEHMGGKTIKTIEKNIDDQILKGKIHVSFTEMGYPEFSYTFMRGNTKHDIHLMSASSSVAELAPFVLFLRYALKKGDFLIFEEPEAHLHPRAQRDLTASLIRLMQQDIHVLITTHSPFLIEQIENCVILQHLKDKSDGTFATMEKRIKKKCDGNSVALTAPIAQKDVMVYSFRLNDKDKRSTISAEKSSIEEGSIGYLPDHHYAIDNEQYIENEAIRDEFEKLEDA